jgi:hypothetical protein
MYLRTLLTGFDCDQGPCCSRAGSAASALTVEPLVESDRAVAMAGRLGLEDEGV